MIRGSTLREKKRKKEDMNPASGTANLADVMLVFAVGLMISIVALFDVSFEDLSSAEQEGSFQRGGYIYTDPETGKRYLVMDNYYDLDK